MATPTLPLGDIPTEWKIRAATGSDLPFIYSSWLKSMRNGSSLGKYCPGSVFFFEYPRIIDQILSHPDTQVRLACWISEPTIFFGYLVSQGTTLHYGFVKEEFRQFGIMKSLIREAGTPKFYTHQTFMVQSIMKKHPEIVYNPFKLFKQGEI